MAMGIIHNNVLNSHLDDYGNRVLDFPITKSECVDGLDERIRQVAVTALYGYGDAQEGQVPSKSSEGLDWFTPIKTVYLGNNVSPVTPTEQGDIRIPIAGEDLGVVKESSEIDIDSEGSILVKSLVADKVMYNEDSSIKEVVNDRTTWKHF